MERNVVSLRLDVSWSNTETQADALAELTAGLEVTFDETGVTAGGGWPEVEFTGSPAHLAVVATRYVGDGDPDNTEIADLLRQIEKTYMAVDPLIDG